MLVDAALTTTDLHKVPDAARAIEAAGYDGIYSFEGPHDAMFPLLLAAEHTERVQLTTAVVIAFARNPMTLAQSAYDLQLASQRPVQPRARHADQAAHREAVLDGVVEARGAHARDGAGDPRDLGALARGHQARLPAASSTRTR